MKRHLVISVLVAMAVVTAAAQTSRKFTYDLTPDGKANMTVYLPDQPTGRAIVDCPGGGYTHLAVAHEGHDWAEWFNRQGIAFFVVAYRFPEGDRTRPMSDVQNAIHTVRDSAQVWHINPRDVGVMGFSAGGHLASAVSTHSDFDCRPDFSILFYPVITMVPREGHRGSSRGFLGDEGMNDERLVKEWSSQNAVRSHLTPPAIIITASDDRTVPVLTNALPYYSAMRRAGNDCALYVYPSGGHGFGFRSSWAYHEQMKTDLTTWLSHIKAPREDALRVACIGNSITDGMGIDMRALRGYPAQMQQLLGDGYDVRNFGVSARTLLNGGDHPYMNEQAWRDVLAYHPDVVIIKLGTNDSKDYNWNAHKQEFEGDLQQMIDALKPLVPQLNKKGRPTKKLMRSDKPDIILCTPIRAFEDKWGITDSVIVNEVAPAIRRVAGRNGLPLLDLHDVITDPKEMTADKIHPNDKGAARIAQAVAEEVKRLKKDN